MKRVAHRRGFTGICLFNPKTRVNIGTCLRSAACFDVNIIYLHGERYRRQASDTMNTVQHIPTIETNGNLLKTLPLATRKVAVEYDDSAIPLHQFAHPESAIYIFGPEDGSIPTDVQKACDSRIFIPSLYCLNLAVAVSIVLYDRYLHTIPVKR